MRDFGKWFNDLTDELRRTQDSDTSVPTPTPLPDGNPGWDTDAFERFLDEGGFINNRGQLVAPCQVCGEDTEVPCDLKEFSIDMHYCGRSPMCCP